jgi:hypothetical protein
MFASARASATALVTVGVAFAAIAQPFPPLHRSTRVDQLARERARLGRPPVLLAPPACPPCR